MEKLLEYWKYEFMKEKDRIVILVQELFSRIMSQAVPCIEGFATTINDFIEFLDSISINTIPYEQVSHFIPPAILRLLAQRVIVFSIAMIFRLVRML